MSVPIMLAAAAALIGAIMGGLSLAVPAWGASVVRLQPMREKPGGWAEFRASYGGMFVALHAAVLLTIAMSAQAGEASVIATGFAAGMAWFGMAVGRLVSIFADHPAQETRTTYNIASTGFELVMAGALMAPFLAHIGG